MQLFLNRLNLIPKSSSDVRQTALVGRRCHTSALVRRQTDGSSHRHTSDGRLPPPPHVRRLSSVLQVRWAAPVTVRRTVSVTIMRQMDGFRHTSGGQLSLPPHVTRTAPVTVTTHTSDGRFPSPSYLRRLASVTVKRQTERSHHHHTPDRRLPFHHRPTSDRWLPSLPHVRQTAPITVTRQTEAPAIVTRQTYGFNHRHTSDSFCDSLHSDGRLPVRHHTPSVITCHSLHMESLNLDAEFAPTHYLNV